MTSRLVYFTPRGPLCFIDYLSVTDGRAVMERIRKAFSGGPRLPKLYQFRLFEKLTNGMVSVDEFALPQFDLKTMSVFLDSIDREHPQLA